MDCICDSNWKYCVRISGFGKGRKLENIADSDLIDALSKISDIADRNSTIRFLKDVASRYALNTIAYFGVGVSGQNEVDPYLAVTYPSEWVEHYKSRQYVDVDPVVRLGFRRMLPLDWDEFGNPTGRLKTFFGEAGEFGIGLRDFQVLAMSVGARIRFQRFLFIRLRSPPA